MKKDTVDVEAIDILLIGDKDEITEGIKRIDAHFCEKIVEIIRKRALSANQDDLLDIYQEVMLGIYEDALKGIYDPDKKALKSFIYKIASNKATDWLRRKFAHKRDTSQDVLIDSVAETIKDSNIREAWEYAYEKEQRAIILKTIRELIPKLKLRQRQVAEIIIENYPDFLSESEIKKQILQRYGEDVTSVAVKRARKEVYSKVKEALSIAGCGDNIND